MGDQTFDWGAWPPSFRRTAPGPTNRLFPRNDRNILNMSHCRQNRLEFHRVGGCKLKACSHHPSYFILSHLNLSEVDTVSCLYVLDLKIGPKCSSVQYSIQ